MPSGASYNPVISPDGHLHRLRQRCAADAGDNNAFADTYVVDVTDPADPVYQADFEPRQRQPPDADANLGAAISAGGLYIAFASSPSRPPPRQRRYLLHRSDLGPQRDHPGKRQLARHPHRGRCHRADRRSQRHHAQHRRIRTARFTASFNADGNIVWHFSEPKSDFAALRPGQKVTSRISSSR